ncbi:hypothetical protein Smic_55160 [Streptomyces microflavus]|uniref:Uncharacterized protein n=1 Tax=Streptomyces microflavus TaxID=1919 RepID=A0A7J0CWQ3_STRMI|nr:hypothetical protein Smic_55160 [Streptomyces microflavus]
MIVTGALLACLALRFCLGRGPLRAPEGAGRAGMYACWLLSFAVYGEELIAQVVSGGPDGPWEAAPAPLLGLTAAVAPAAWCAHFFTVQAHRKLTGSRALEEFGAGVRPLLLAAVVLFLCALLPLLFLADLGLGGTGTPVSAAALGVLFFLARLLAAHGLPEPGTVALAAACAVEAAAPPSSSPDGCPASNRWPGPCTPSSRRAAPDPYLPSPVARRPWGSCSTPPPPSPGPPPTPTPHRGLAAPTDVPPTTAPPHNSRGADAAGPVRHRTN